MRTVSASPPSLSFSSFPSVGTVTALTVNLPSFFCLRFPRSSVAHRDRRPPARARHLRLPRGTQRTTRDAHSLWYVPDGPSVHSRSSVLIVGLSYGARNVLSYTRREMQNFLAFRDSPIKPLGRSLAFSLFLSVCVEYLRFPAEFLQGLYGRGREEGQNRSSPPSVVRHLLFEWASVTASWWIPRPQPQTSSSLPPCPSVGAHE